MVNYLYSGAKDTSAAAAKDRRHLTKGRVIDDEEAVRMREEKMQKDAVKHIEPKIAKSSNKLLLLQNR